MLSRKLIMTIITLAYFETKRKSLSKKERKRKSGLRKVRVELNV